jgi:hypothetical protein
MLAARSRIAHRARVVAEALAVVAAAWIGAASFASAVSCTTASKACTTDLRFHRVEMSREVAATAPKAPLRVEACVATRCATANAAADGTLGFATEAGGNGASGGSLTAGPEPGKMRLVVTFNVQEGERNAKTPLLVRVLDSSGATVHESTAQIEWNDDVCHPSPASTTL